MLDYENMKCGKLSGGMQRRVGVAQAILGNPSVVFLDEPTVSLDIEERENFKKIIKEISDDKIIILSTHILEDVTGLCDNIVVMSEGKIICSDSVQNIATNYEDIREFYLRTLNASI